MTVSEWWCKNGKLFTAWVAHTLTLIVLSTGILYLNRSFPVSDTLTDSTRHWTLITVSRIAASLAVMLSISLYLFRFYVLRLIVLKERWASNVPRHPYRPYVAAWGSYMIVSYGIFIAASILFPVFSIPPWLGNVFRGIVLFLVFRLAVKKFIMPYRIEGGRITR